MLMGFNGISIGFILMVAFVSKKPTNLTAPLVAISSIYVLRAEILGVTSGVRLSHLQWVDQAESGERCWALQY